MKTIVTLLATLLISTTALAHVTLQQRTTSPGMYRAVLQVPHGCAGKATTELRVSIPAQMDRVRPMPKAGWQLEITREDDQVTELRWFGGELLDEHYDEFIFRGRIAADAQGELLVPVLQYCGDEVSRWIEADTSTRYPAARVVVQ